MLDTHHHLSFVVKPVSAWMAERDGCNRRRRSEAGSQHGPGGTPTVLGGRRLVKKRIPIWKARALNVVARFSR
jgi:hypothetical protein